MSLLFNIGRWILIKGHSIRLPAKPTDNVLLTVSIDLCVLQGAPNRELRRGLLKDLI